MEYATREDLVDRFSEAELAPLEDLGNSGSPDAGVSARALSDAAAEINSYLAVRYALPLPSVPEALVRVACDIARYRLHQNAPTAEVKARYEHALKWLEDVRDGRAALVFKPTAEEPAPPLTVRPDPVTHLYYDGGVFGDRALARMIDPADVIQPAPAWIHPRRWGRL